MEQLKFYLGLADITSIHDWGLAGTAAGYEISISFKQPYTRCVLFMRNCAAPFPPFPTRGVTGMIIQFLNGAATARAEKNANAKERALSAT